MMFNYPKKINHNDYLADDLNPKVLYGLPKNVVFCKTCAMSNQKPISTVEFKHLKHEKKHGINIDRNNSNISKNKLEKKSTKSYFGFYSYLLILLFIVTTITGILHLTKEIVIFYFPFTEIYIEILFENLNNFGILFRDTFNLY